VDYGNMLCRTLMYKSSTFLRAHGVRRKNFKLDLSDGLWVKH